MGKGSVYGIRSIWPVGWRLVGMVGNQMVWLSILQLALLPILASPAGVLQDSPDLGRQVNSLMEKGRPGEAEEILKKVLGGRPDDLQALMLLAMVLDRQGRYEEAEGYHHRALELAPNAVSLRNNLGNHYLARGLVDRARDSYLAVLAVTPDHANANLQLARIRLNEGKADESLRHLSRLSPAERASPAVQLIEAPALHQIGRKETAQELLARLLENVEDDPRLAFSIGMIYVGWHQFEDAERAFTIALRHDPAHITILYNLGLAAAKAGHLDRARDVLETVVGRQPDNVDCLYSLAGVSAQLDRLFEAADLLVRAGRLAPERPEIPLFLARLSEKAGLFGDAVAAYDAYLQLRPDDDAARRERVFAVARSGNVTEGFEELKRYTEKHAQDALGWHALAMVESATDLDQALLHLNEALRLDPGLANARYARAALKLLQGSPLDTVKDLEIFLKSEQTNADALTLVGQAQLALGNPKAAVGTLEQALKFAPDNSTALFNYSKALRLLGREAEYRSALERFKKVSQHPTKPRRGLLEFLSLPPAEREQRHIENLRRAVASDPRNLPRKLTLAQALMSRGETAEALSIFQTIFQMASDPAVKALCGKVLVGQGHYVPARQFLESLESPTLDSLLDLTLATFHTAGAEAALQRLECVRPEQRNGDYFLLRAQLLDDLGKLNEAVDSLNRGFSSAPGRVDLLFQGVLFLIEHEHYAQAATLAEQAARRFPDAGELAIARAIALEMSGDTPGAQTVLRAAQSRWPEWHFPHLLHGIILETHGQSSEARAMLETAINLGASEASAYYFYALATLHAAPYEREAVANATAEAIRLSPEDPYVRFLAGREALRRKDLAAARDHLEAAVRSLPDLSEARHTLSAVYRALGEIERAKAEQAEARRVEQEDKVNDRVKTPVRDLLFAVAGARSSKR